MLIYVEIFGTQGLARLTPEPCTVDPALPTWVLTSDEFLGALRQQGAAAACRVYHVEGGRFVDEEHIGAAGVRDLDTLVIVNSDDPRVHDRRVLAGRSRRARTPRLVA